MLSTPKKLHLTPTEIFQLSFLLETSEDIIRAMTHQPAKLLKRIDSVLERDVRLDEVVKLFRAYFLPLWQERLSLYKE